MECQFRRHRGIPREVAMGPCLVISSLMSMGGIILPIMVVRDRVVVMTEGMGCAWMGKKRKG